MIEWFVDALNDPFVSAVLKYIGFVATVVTVLLFIRRLVNPKLQNPTRGEVESDIERAQRSTRAQQEELLRKALKKVLEELAQRLKSTVSPEIADAVQQVLRRLQDILDDVVKDVNERRTELMLLAARNEALEELVTTFDAHVFDVAARTPTTIGPLTLVSGFLHAAAARQRIDQFRQ